MQMYMLYFNLPNKTRKNYRKTINNSSFARNAYIFWFIYDWENEKSPACVSAHVGLKRICGRVLHVADTDNLYLIKRLTTTLPWDSASLVHYKMFAIASLEIKQKPKRTTMTIINISSFD